MKYISPFHCFEAREADLLQAWTKHYKVRRIRYLVREVQVKEKPVYELLVNLEDHRSRLEWHNVKIDEKELAASVIEI